MVYLITAVAVFIGSIIGNGIGFVIWRWNVKDKISPKFRTATSKSTYKVIVRFGNEGLAKNFSKELESRGFSLQIIEE